MTNRDRVLEAIRGNPGKTGRELSKIMFGENGYQQRISVECRILELRGIIYRCESGHRRDLYRYFIAEKSERVSRDQMPINAAHIYESFLLERKVLLERRLSMFEDELGNALAMVRGRDIDAFNKLDIPTETDIGVTLSLLRATNVQISRCRTPEEQDV